MQEVSDAVGYQDVVFFRKIFQRHTEVSPQRIPAEVWHLAIPVRRRSCADRI
ncbi:hypothetical protein [Alloacidobacterium dinghuense]|uniref:hypothetical protein n=1 Tax=Alloacidobacterium dinghuense TaxID=2763107 RepID=UPI003D80155C